MSAASLKTHQKPLKFIFPRKNTLYGAEAFLKNLLAKHRLTTTLRGLPVSLIGVDIGFHARIKDHFAVFMAIIDPIKAHDRSLKGEANLFCNAF